ncbi:MAG TPA: hypothetical protein VLK58_12005, partial [Conexibacter sp.]|nr:hypothetical protein [Conexibacter sp.]
RRLRRAYSSRRDRAAAGLRSLTDDDEETLDRVTAGVEALGRLRREMIDAERDELIRWRDAGRLPDASLRVLERELDYQEGSLPG